MSIPVPLRRDFDAPGLRRVARSSKDANQARRLLALATVYAGGTRTQAAEMGGVGLQIVRDWVVRFNSDGPAGLLDRKAPGQPALLDDRHRRALAELIEQDLSPPSTASCAGGWSIWHNGSGKSSGSRSRRRPWAAS
jgi:transposase